MKPEYIDLPPRDGIHIRGEIFPATLELRAKSRRLVLYTEDFINLYIEGQREPLYTEGVRMFREHKRFLAISEIQFVDMAFQKFIDEGDFSSVKNHDYTAILMQCALEKTAGANWKDKTYRFVRARRNEIIRMRGDARLAALLTKDRRDIIEAEQAEFQSTTAVLIADAEYRIGVAGGRIAEERPITKDEKRFLEKLEGTDTVHYFEGSQSKPPLTIFDTEVESRKHGSGEEYFAPTRESLAGHEFLSLIVRSGLMTNEQIKQVLVEPPENFDVSNWQKLDWQKWPAFGVKRDNLVRLARFLGKKGIQVYKYDTGYGDMSEFWKAGYIEAADNQ